MRKKDQILVDRIRPKTNYGEYNPDDFVICCICGDQLRSISNTHLMFKHQINSIEYLRRFPNAILKCKATRNKISKNSSNMWKNPEFKIKMRKKLKIVCNTPFEKKRRSRVMKDLHMQNNSPYNEEWKEKIAQSNIEAWKNPTSRKKRVAIIRETHSTSEYKSKMSEIQKENWSNKNHTYNTLDYRKKISHGNIKHGKYSKYKEKGE